MKKDNVDHQSGGPTTLTLGMCWPGMWHATRGRKDWLMSSIQSRPLFGRRERLGYSRAWTIAGQYNTQYIRYAYRTSFIPLLADRRKRRVKLLRQLPSAAKSSGLTNRDRSPVPRVSAGAGVRWLLPYSAAFRSTVPYPS